MCKMRKMSNKGYKVQKGYKSYKGDKGQKGDKSAEKRRTYRDYL